MNEPGDAADGPDPAALARRVRRVDGRLGLASSRVPLSGRSLVTYARDHITVRTPSRPDFRDGNTLDLEVPPAPDTIGRWVDRFRTTIGSLGAPHVQLRWEVPHGTSAEDDAGAANDGSANDGSANDGGTDGGSANDGGTDGGVVLDPAVRDACAGYGLAVDPVTVLLLDELVAPRPAPVELVAVAAPTSDPDAPTDRRWYAATVLYRYEQGDDPDDWRDVDDTFTTWSVDVQRELAMAQRLQLWLAMRHGAPVGRAVIVHDRQGLAVVEDVIVHPAHRQLGIAAALTHRAVAHHLDEHPGDRVALAAVPGSSADRIYRRLGFRPHATVWTARTT